MILVVGSTGMVGSEICRLLASQGMPLRAMVRESSDSAKVERLKGLGAQIVKGSLCDPKSLKAACQGASAVICTVSAMPFCYQPGVNDIQSVDLEGVNNLIEAAKAAHVKQFVYTSFSGNLDRDFPLRNAKRAVEKHLKESGLVYTILRPSMFMEVWLSPAVGFDAANAKATIYGSGDQPIAWIAIKDVARFAVESLTNKAARNRVLELGGPESLSPHQVIKLFEAAKGKGFEVTHVPPEALQGQYDGAADPMQKSFIGLMLCYAAGDPIEMSGIQKSFGFQLTPVKAYIESAA
ncbi:MAG: SDR family oxidoreductase [Anaerolineales bacterium]